MICAHIMVLGPREKVHPGLVLTDGGRSDFLAGLSGPHALSQALAVIHIFNAAIVLYSCLAINYKFVTIVILSPVSLC